MNPQPQNLPPAAQSPRAAVARIDVTAPQQPRLRIQSLATAEKRMKSGSILDQMYRPHLPVYSVRGAEVLSYYFFSDVEVMRMHSCVRLPLSYVMSPLHHAEWVVEGTSRAAAIFTAKMLQWWWQHALHGMCHEGYTYGWSATELNYKEDESGLLVFDEARTFCPRDCVPLIHNKTRRPVGIRIMGNLGGCKDLWAWRDNVPNKGLWYTHQPRHGMLIGESQIRSAWRPWRRKAGADGLEEIMDQATYKHGVGVTIVKHPNEEENAEDAAMPQYAQNGIVHTRDIARSIAQNSRAGSAIALSSENWPGLNGGGPKWDYEVKSFSTNIDQLGNHNDMLSRECSRAIGVPPELFEAAQTGSGYSGREIPLEGFLEMQQENLKNITQAVVKYAILPLVKWNYGQRENVNVMPKRLLDTAHRAQGEGSADNPQGTTANGQPAGLSGQMPSGGDGGNVDDGTPMMMSRRMFRDPSKLSLRELLEAVSTLEGMGI